MLLTVAVKMIIHLFYLRGSHRVLSAAEFTAAHTLGRVPISRLGREPMQQVPKRSGPFFGKAILTWGLAVRVPEGIVISRTSQHAKVEGIQVLLSQMEGRSLPGNNTRAGSTLPF